MAALAFWSQELTPGKPAEISPAYDIKITNVALGDVLADENGRTTIKVVYQKISPPSDDDDEDIENDDGTPTTTVVCSLTPSKIEQATIDLVLLQESRYIFELVGKNTVYLTGYYVDQNDNQPPGQDEFDSDMDSEDDHDLRFVSSDVEIEPDELESDASRFEEVEDEKPEKPQSKKRSRESAGADEEKPESKAEKKSKKQKTEEKTAEEKKGKKDKGDKKEKGGEKQLPGGLKVKDAKVGTGPMAKKGQTISMRYIGKLQNGKVFDQNTKGKPFKFRLGAGEVIKGWDEGIVGMQVGGERVLTVPPEMGYGKKGSAPIPPNATLIFEVKCIDIK
ncbi:peptidylprolyl isomerase fpr3 [Stygiomarasmius scandens]|uniref:peptidylprolyl isomerase n=1 Tax=Marasmiellus scandens TaxID=2682957 RepID=A0ABR1K793_9AGAR